MHLYGTDRVLLREIADGLSSVKGGRMDSLLPLIGAGLVTGERISTTGGKVYRNVMLTHSGLAYLYPSDGFFTRKPDWAACDRERRPRV